jgi:tRNA(Ile)-lysidine synthase
MTKSAFASEIKAALGRLAASHNCREMIIAFSGGMDSTVLLRLAVEYTKTADIEIRAVHVNHGLAARSADWAAHCLQVAKRLGVPCDVLTVGDTPPAGASIEAWARDKRYSILAELVQAGSFIVTAHHADDQAETVLQRVVSGAGPHGLSAMKEQRRFGLGHIVRPMLHHDYAQIAAFARTERLEWIDDPSNHDPRYLRNRSRHSVLPLLESTYPGATRGLQRLARVQASVSREIDAWCTAVVTNDGRPAGQLSIVSLRECSRDMQGFLLRHVILQTGLEPPRERHIREILQQVLTARGDAAPLVRWSASEVRRYREVLYFGRAQQHTVPAARIPWQIDSALCLPWGELLAHPVPGRGLAQRYLRQSVVEIGFRQGGERCRPAGQLHGRSLKKILQDLAVPPWQRGTLPLLFIDGQVAAVGGLFICEEFVAQAEEPGVELDWRRHAEQISRNSW